MPSKSVPKMSQLRRTLESHGLLQKCHGFRDILLDLLSFLPLCSLPSLLFTHFPSLSLLPLLPPFVPPFLSFLSSLSYPPLLPSSFPSHPLLSSPLLRDRICLIFDRFRRSCVIYGLPLKAMTCSVASPGSAPGSSETFELKFFECNQLIS